MVGSSPACGAGMTRIRNTVVFAMGSLERGTWCGIVAAEECTVGFYRASRYRGVTEKLDVLFHVVGLSTSGEV